MADAIPEEMPWLLTLRSLVRLRWAAIGAQVLVIAFAHLASVDDASILWPVALVAVMGATNAVLQARMMRAESASDRLLVGVLLFDVVLLTALLTLTGGPGNPFSVTFLVHVTLASVVLGARWAWALALATVTAFGALFFIVPEHALHAMHRSGFTLHLQGMWVAFAATAALIAYFVTRIAAELRAREAEVRELQGRAARSDKLASLSTLAAGAAHELGTPLGTIALAAKELERALESVPQASLREDARLIRTEVDRCRAIINQLSANAGESSGEMSIETPLHDLTTHLTESLAEAERPRVRAFAEEGVMVTLPRVAIVQALRTLVRNGLDAGPGEVRVDLRRTESRVLLTVEDFGSGMPSDVLARAGEPFFTTKSPGRGLGLGLFLVRAVAERLGGALTLKSEPGRGTVACIDLPGVRR
jgi:two-component system sensor histidine kinase RegB